MENSLIEKTVRAANIRGNAVTGKVILVYTDAMASGTNEYIPVTLLSVEDKDGIIHPVYPRDLIETVKEETK